MSSCQLFVTILMKFPLPPKSYVTIFFRGAQDLLLVQLKLIMLIFFSQKNTHGGLFRKPPKNALYHTVKMVLVDPCDKLIICFLWVLKGGKHNYILSLHQ